jgi:hypothetical protein
MRTIPRNWHGRINGGTATCGICGVRWPRAKLRYDGEGQLVCPDEGRGLDGVTLERMNALYRERPLPRPDSTPVEHKVRAPDQVFGVLQSGWWRADEADVSGQDQVRLIQNLMRTGHDVRTTSAGYPPRLVQQAVGGHTALREGTIAEASDTQFTAELDAQVSFWAVWRPILVNTQALSFTSAGTYILGQAANSPNVTIGNGFTTAATTSDVELGVWYRIFATWHPETRLRVGSELVTAPGTMRSTSGLRLVLTLANTARRLGELAECGLLTGEHTTAQELALDEYITERYRGEVQL